VDIEAALHALRVEVLTALLRRKGAGVSRTQVEELVRSGANDAEVIRAFLPAPIWRRVGAWLRFGRN